MLVEMGWFSVVMTIGVLVWGTTDGMVMLVMIGFGLLIRDVVNFEGYSVMTIGVLVFCGDDHWGIGVGDDRWDGDAGNDWVWGDLLWEGVLVTVGCVS